MFYRGVAQLVARVVWDHEVAGSIPVTSTIIKRRLKEVFFFIINIILLDYKSVDNINKKRTRLLRKEEI